MHAQRNSTILDASLGVVYSRTLPFDTFEAKVVIYRFMSADTFVVKNDVLSELSVEVHWRVTEWMVSKLGIVLSARMQ